MRFGEYIGGLIMLTLGGFGLISKLAQWKGLEESRTFTLFLKIIGMAATLLGVAATPVIIQYTKGNTPWSQLPGAWDKFIDSNWPTPPLRVDLHYPTVPPIAYRTLRKEILQNHSALLAKAPNPKLDAEVKVTAYTQPLAHSYPKGLLIGGIVWDDNYVDVRLDITIGSIPIHDVDVLTGLDTSIAGLGQITQFPAVVAFPSNEVPPSWIEGTDETWKSVAMPMTPVPGMGYMAPVYRVRCAKLFSNTVLHLIIASVALNSPTSEGGLPQHLFATRRSPKTIRLKGTYKLSERDVVQHPIEFSHVF